MFLNVFEYETYRKDYGMFWLMVTERVDEATQAMVTLCKVCPF